MRPLRVCSLLFTASALLLFSGCENHKPADASDAPAPQYRVLDTVIAHVQPVHDQLTLAARIQENPTTVVHIYPPISGRVLALKVLPGQEVARGQVVVMLQSTDLQQARSDYEKARIEAARADLQLNRGRDLLQHEVMSQKDFDDLNALDEAAHAELSRTLQTLHILGYKETDTSDLVAIRSPIQGVVLDVNTASGELQRSLDNATAIATIANINDVWVVADLYPRDVQAVRRGQAVEVRVNGYPDTIFHGVIDNISDAVDAQTLTLKVRVVLPNPHHRLKPQMYATVAVTNQKRNAIVLPATAVIRDGVSTYVYIQTGENKYDRRDVRIGEAHDATVEITGGLNEGDRVVSTGAELLRGAGSE
jgi:cobalt-zinc-cadmium efflux system membrane fusion protein